MQAQSRCLIIPRVPHVATAVQSPVPHRPRTDLARPRLLHARRDTIRQRSNQHERTRARKHGTTALAKPLSPSMTIDGSMEAGRQQIRQRITSPPITIDGHVRSSKQ